MTRISRRNLLASAAAAPLLVSAEPQQTAADPPKRMKVVVTGGHPGDPEYGCGGTIARYADLGHEVVVLYFNRGQKTCPEQPGDPGSTVRVAEAKHACEILKARAAFAGQCDAHAVVDNAHYDEFRAQLEAQQPDVVFTHWPIDKHRDHSALSLLVHDTWLRSGRKFALYYYEVAEDTMMFQPSDYVDITAVLARRHGACYAHASQTPDHFYPAQVQISKFRGTESGYSEAEAFTRHWLSREVALP